MITGTHTILYAEDAEAARAFFRDVLQMPHVDDGGGWLIFALPPGEVALHPADPATPTTGHELFLTCDDLETTVAELRSRGVEFVADITDAGWGLLTALRVPGAGALSLYEPRHRTAFGLQA
ncbi:hypothetical protein BH20ACT8_BH20ACT8_10320 [soil metagenome]|jgi:catechol 2,3-dioxygenase-like lactoylglutathione lyase family enzyme